MYRLTRSFAAVLMLVLAGSLYAQPPAADDIARQPGRGMYLGVLVEELSLPRLDALQLPYGVEVSRVFPGSPAETAGLRAGDIIQELEGQAVFSVPRLRWLVGRFAAREAMQLRFYRDGRSATAAVRLQGVQRAPPGLHHGRRQRGERAPSYLGINLQPLTPGLREAFSVPDGIGVLIAEVHADSPAARSGLSAGDVIVKMDRRSIREIADVHRVLDYFEPGEQLDMEVIRDGAKQELKVTLGERAAPSAPGREGGWTEPQASQPFFDPAWWDEIQDFMERWKEYFQEKQARRPPAAL